MLAANEVWSGGFVRDRATRTIVITRQLAGAVFSGGFLRDPDGRLVVTP